MEKSVKLHKTVITVATLVINFGTDVVQLMSES